MNRKYYPISTFQNDVYHYLIQSYNVDMYTHTQHCPIAQIGQLSPSQSLSPKWRSSASDLGLLFIKPMPLFPVSQIKQTPTKAAEKQCLQQQQLSVNSE